MRPRLGPTRSPWARWRSWSSPIGSPCEPPFQTKRSSSPPLGGGGGSRLDQARSHGDYLLRHLHVLADGSPLVGRVVERPERAEGRPSYGFEFRFPGGAPDRLVLREDVLRDIEFAPGLPWEASYVVKLGHEGQPPIEGVLLTCRQPLEFQCRWGHGAAESLIPPDPESSRTPVVLGFVEHGILHILTGYDHLLFVGALMLAVASQWDLIKVISAFTLAHTITLAVSVLDIFRLPSEIVEPMIAGSIVVVAVQNVFWPDSSRGRGRLLVAFGFGLLHGLGFAGGLLEVISGMRVADAALAIVAFSIGVEIGHEFVVLPTFAILRLVRPADGDEVSHDRIVRRYGSIAISVSGVVYLVLAFR